MAFRILQHYWQPPLAFLALTEAIIFCAAPFIANQLGWSISNTNVGLSLPVLTLLQAMLFGAAMFVAMAAMGMYNSRQRSRLAGLFARICVAVVAAVLIVAIVAFLFPDLRIGRGVMLTAALIAVGASSALRCIFDRLVDEDVFKRRVLIYGAGKRAASIARLRRRSDRRGFVVTGYLLAEGDDPVGVPQSEQIPTPDSLLRLCEQHSINEIIVAMDDRRVAFPMDQLLECRLEGVEVIDLVTFLERETGKVRLDVLNPSWMIFSSGFRQGFLYGVLERCLDVAASLLLLIVALPLMVFAVLAIKLEEGPNASIFYGQVRVGQYGRPFKLLKFRSMRENAEADGKAQWAKTDDPRVTRVGSFIRKTRIDELPQIINVLRGHMSFVGPRPERPEFVSHLNERIPYYRERHAIKPGITGWAQLCYPYGSSEQDAVEKLQYDLYYVKNHSPLFYLAIAVQTVEVILWRKGAR